MNSTEQNNVRFKKYYIWFEEKESSRAIDIMEDALMDAEIYWDLEEA